MLDACRAAGISRTAAYEWRENDEVFRAAWNEAMDEAADRAEREAWRRAVEGVDKPLIGRVGKDQDGVIEVVKEYSDTILLRLLGARRPTVWRERSVGLQATLTAEDLAKMSDQELEHLKQQLS